MRKLIQRTLLSSVAAVAVGAVVFAPLDAAATETASTDLTPNSGMTHTWLNRNIVPRGQRINEGANDISRLITRSGVSGQITGANGPLWRTVVWFGAHSSTGQDSANVSGPHSGNFAAASFEYRPGGLTDNDLINVRSWLTGAQMAGLSETAPDAITHLGEISGYAFYKATTDNGDVCLEARYGEWTFSSCASSDDFAQSGVPLTGSGPGVFFQALLVPDGLDLHESVSDLGVVLINDELVVNTGAPIDTTISVSRPTDRTARRDGLTARSEDFEGRLLLP